MENFFLFRWWKTSCLNKILIIGVGGLMLFCFFGVALAMFGALIGEVPAEEPTASVITPQVSPTLTPTLSPIENVLALCLKIQSPSVPDQVKDLQEGVRGFIEPLGVKVYLSYTAECDAELVIDVKLRALGDSYLDDQTHLYRVCYPGASAKGELVFRFVGASRHFEIDGRVPAGNYITKCPTSEEAPFVSAWREEVFLSIYELWGIEVLPVAVGHKFISSKKFRDTVILLYEHEGPKALSTAPDLINELGKGDSIIETAAIQALKIISGEDFGKNQTAWKQWWSEQSKSPTQPVALEPENIIFIANPPFCSNPDIFFKDEVIMRVRWGAATPELAESQADQMKIVLSVDGEDMGEVASYRQSAKEYSSFKEYGCGPEQVAHWIHWDVPVGQLSRGKHKLALKFILDEAIKDGESEFLAGPLNFLSTFSVSPDL